MRAQIAGLQQRMEAAKTTLDSAQAVLEGLKARVASMESNREVGADFDPAEYDRTITEHNALVQVCNRQRALYESLFAEYKGAAERFNARRPGRGE